MRRAGGMLALCWLLACSACSKQKDCDATTQLLHDNQAALDGLRDELKQLTPKISNARVRAERLAAGVRELATKAEQLSVDSEALRAPLEAYRETLRVAASAAEALQNHAVAISGEQADINRADAEVAKAKIDIQGLCDKTAEICGGILPILDEAIPNDDAAAFSQALDDQQKRVAALKIEDAELAKAVSALANALEHSASALRDAHSHADGLVAATKTLSAALDEAGRAQQALSALCK